MEPNDFKTKNTSVKFFSGYMLIAVFAVSAAVFLNQLIDMLDIKSLSQAYGEVEKRQFSRNLWELVTFSGFLVPLIEELVFRQFLYKRLRKIKGALFAAIASAALFGLYHMNLVQFIYAFFMGLFICLVYECYDGFVSGLFFHVCANLFVIAAFFLPAYIHMQIKLISCIFGGIVTVIITVHLLGRKNKA